MVLDIDHNPISVARYKVVGIPKYIIFQDGEITDSFVGVMPKDVFLKRILDVIE